MQEDLANDREREMMAYDRKTAEAKWSAMWEEKGINAFHWPSDAPIYSIDVPPRYANAALHLGHATSYSHIDFAARYKRQRGFNVFNPLCADTNGMPIEIAVEKRHGITKKSLPRQEYLKLCRDFANENIGAISKQFKMLGHSFDPALFYQTDAPYYRRITQITFLRMLAKGLVYRGMAPVIWCPTCETAIADPEMEYKTRKTKLNYIKFRNEADGADVEIATTRPELLCTCQLIAVHPTDEKLKHLIGKTLLTPIYKRPIKVIADEAVDPEFGTGVVMICSVGDTGDLEWIYKYKLEMQKGIDEEGRMTGLSGKYAGMKVVDAKKAILEDLEAAGLLVKQEELEQNVGTCWRCHSPTEFLQKTQWFLKTLDFKEQVLAASKEIDWHPPFMEGRLIAWVNSLNRDWVISRQRFFATPIPVWQCDKCGKFMPAEEGQCYVDPTVDNPPKPACDCGGSLKGCEEVFDTWMDSSISPLYNSFYLRDEEKFKAVYPMSLRPQAHEIIRTWTFYTILRCLQVTGIKPWKETQISGFIMAPDGTPIHTSLGNVIDPIPLLEEFGSDAVRYFAATCTLGVDQAFQHKEVVHGQKLATKLYNIHRFISMKLAGHKGEPRGLRPVDQWVLREYDALVAQATAHFDKYEYDKAVRLVENFTWHVLADHYLELVKHRDDSAAKFVLATVGLGSLKMLAPIMPFITEDIFQEHYLGKLDDAKSIHVSKWPEASGIALPDAGKGAFVKELAAEVRSWKAGNGIALNQEFALMELVGDRAELIDGSEEDVCKTTGAREIRIGSPKDIKEAFTGIKPNKALLGPKHKGNAGKVMKALSAVKPEEIGQAFEAGEAFKLVLEDGTAVDIGKDEVALERSATIEGRKVETLDIEGCLVLLARVEK